MRRAGTSKGILAETHTAMPRQHWHMSKILAALELPIGNLVKLACSTWLV
jgi:hypothetical protein